jgi:hypothetical protein
LIDIFTQRAQSNCVFSGWLKVGVFEEGLDVDEEFAHGGDDGALECSPKVDPGVMRVCGAEAPLTSNETKET